jgi:hypothetical protein
MPAHSRSFFRQLDDPVINADENNADCFRYAGLAGASPEMDQNL